MGNTDYHPVYLQAGLTFVSEFPTTLIMVNQHRFFDKPKDIANKLDWAVCRHMASMQPMIQGLSQLLNYQDFTQGYYILPLYIKLTFK